MKKLIVCIWCCFALLASAQHTGIHFSNDSINVVLKQAKRENKIIMVDCFTSWCGPCREMDKNVFTNTSVGNFYNANFINVHLDMEKGQGKKFAQKYEIKCYPTFVFLDGSGKLLHRISGGRDTVGFIAIGATALDIYNRYVTFERAYQSGTASIHQFIDYMNMRQLTCLPVADMIKEYENKIAETDLVSRGSWTLLTTLIESKDSRLFRYLCSHRNLFDTRYTPDSVDQVIGRVYSTALLRCLWKNPIDTAGYRIIQNEIAALNQPIGKKILQRGNIQLLYMQKDWEKYAQAVISYLEEYWKTEAHNTFNDYAWYFYEHIDNIEHLNVALSWARQSVAMQPSYFNTDTYAALLYKLGRYKEAHIWANIAITLAKEGELNYSETEKLLIKIDNHLNILKD